MSISGMCSMQHALWLNLGNHAGGHACSSLANNKGCNWYWKVLPLQYLVLQAAASLCILHALLCTQELYDD